MVKKSGKTHQLRLVVEIYHYLQGFIYVYIPGCCLGFLPSRVSLNQPTLFESMIFLFSFGGICDSCLKGRSKWQQFAGLWNPFTFEDQFTAAISFYLRGTLSEKSIPTQNLLQCVQYGRGYSKLYNNLMILTIYNNYENSRVPLQCHPPTNKALSTNY